MDVPRDRDSSFEPQIVKKHQTRLTAMDDKIHYLYAKGLSTREIVDTFKEMYDADISPTLISKVSFTSALELVELLEIAKIKGELKKKITALCKFDLIIIDELGYLPLNKQDMFNLF